MIRQILVVGTVTMALLAGPLYAGEIHTAAQKGDLAKVKAVAEADPQAVHAPDDDGNLPLHLACAGGYRDVVATLLKYGARVNAGDRDESTPLDVACQRGHKAVAGLLLEHGADLKHKDVAGMTALHFAAYQGHADVADMLLDRGADINARRANGSTPLHGAALSGHEAAVRLLLKRGADINAKNDNGYRPLQTAIFSNSVATVTFLIEHGADLEAQLEGGQTALGIAVRQEGDAEMVKALLAKGANVKGVEGANSTPLHGAMRLGRADVAQLLIEKGAEVNAVDSEGVTPLLIAGQGGKAELIGLLVKAGADVNARDPHFKRTALHWAALNGHRAVTDTLLENRADIDVQNDLGATPVQLAARYGHRDVVKTLTAKGASAENLKGNYGFSLLLTQKLHKGGAELWYLGHCGWAVKTKNHLLIFDYWNPDGDPAAPSLANGHINPAELAEQNVTVFVTHEHRDHFDPSIFAWADNLSHIRYVHSVPGDLWQAAAGADRAGSNYEYIGPREKRTIGGMEIATIAANDAGVGFLVMVDGLTIYHAGDHAGWADGARDGFIGEIDYLAGLVDRVDFAMLNISGCHAHDPERLREGTHYTMNKLNPRVMIPTHSLNHEYLYREAADEARKAGIEAEFYCPQVRGDHFSFREGKTN